MTSAPSTDGTNPNNCSTCEHKQLPDGGWCYMFRLEPTKQCMQHTGLQRYSMNEVQELIRRILP